MLSFELIAGIGLVLLVVVIIAINDWTKRISARRAMRTRSKPRPQDCDNKTDWVLLAFIAVGLIAGIYLSQNNDWVQVYHGPGKRVIRWLFRSELP